MWEEHDVVPVEQPWIYGRFAFVDIECSAGEVTLSEGCEQRLFVDDISPACVHQEGVPAHLPEPLGVHEVDRFRRGRTVQ